MEDKFYYEMKKVKNSIINAGSRYRYDKIYAINQDVLNTNG